MPKFRSNQTTHGRPALAEPSRARSCSRAAVNAVMNTAGALVLSTLMACASQTPAPLYQRLGGEVGIEAVVQRTLTRVSQDPRGAHHFKGIKMPFLIHSVAMHICLVADGPCVYEGDTMVKSHASLHVHDSAFEFMVEVLREELDAAGVSTADKNELLRRLAPMKHEVVQP